MALFKILKGDSARISTDITPFHDGYAYFTPDNVGFYIDSEDNGVQKRYRINPENSGTSTSVSSVLLASGWSNNQQTLVIDGITANSNGIIGLAQSATTEEIESAQSADLYICGQGVDTITVAILGKTPSHDIPIEVILFN